MIDGDTVEIAFRPPEPMPERVRLLNVDTPERGDPGYKEAGDLLRRLLGSGADLRLVFDDGAARPTRDAYGRVLAYVLADGRNVNVEIVRQGWSAYETDFGAGLFPDEFKAAEAEARRERRGLWKTR